MKEGSSWWGRLFANPSILIVMAGIVVAAARARHQRDEFGKRSKKNTRRHTKDGAFSSESAESSLTAEDERNMRKYAGNPVSTLREVHIDSFVDVLKSTFLHRDKHALVKWLRRTKRYDLDPEWTVSDRVRNISSRDKGRRLEEILCIEAELRTRFEEQEKEKNQRIEREKAVAPTGTSIDSLGIAIGKPVSLPSERSFPSSSREDAATTAHVVVERRSVINNVSGGTRIGTYPPEHGGSEGTNHLSGNHGSRANMAEVADVLNIISQNVRDRSVNRGNNYSAQQVDEEPSSNINSRSKTRLPRFFGFCKGCLGRR